jgi:hypothetical protein
VQRPSEPQPRPPPLDDRVIHLYRRDLQASANLNIQFTQLQKRYQLLDTQYKQQKEKNN